MKKEISLYEFEKEFKSMNRDYYSYDGYKALFDYYNEFEDFDLDIISICCDVSEYTKEELIKECGYLLDYEEFAEDFKGVYSVEETEEEYLNELISILERKTGLIKLDNGSFLVWVF